MGTITLGTELPKNQKIVNTVSDFPEPVGDVITLEDNICYFLGADIVTDNRFVCGVENTIVSDGNFCGSLVSTNSGDMFTGTNVTFDAHRCTVGAPNATQVFNFSDTTPRAHVFSISNVTISDSVKFGTFTSLLGFVANFVSSLTTDDGITMIGDGVVFSVGTTNMSINATGKGIDLGTSTFPTLEIVNFRAVGTAPGAIGLSGLASSGNIVSGFIGEVSNSEFIGAITPLENITVSDIRWEFTNTSPLSDSVKSADTFLTASRTVPIVTQGVYVQIGGTDWSSDIAERFSATTAGVLTYLGEIDTQSMVIMTLTVEKSGGGSDQICGKIAINGTPSDKTIACSENNTPTSLTCIGIFNLSENDTIDGRVENTDSTTDIIVSSANVTTINGF